MQRELHRTAEFGTERADHVVPAEHEDRMPEVAAEQHRADGECADEDGRDGECNERQCHHRRTLVGGAAVAVIVVVRRMNAGGRAETLRPVKRQEQHAEGVQRGHEHPAQHAPVGVGRAPAVRLADRLDDRVLGVEAGEERRADERQRADPAGHGRDRHVPGKPAHPAHVLLVVQGDDDRAGGEEQQRLEERVGHQVKDCRAIGGNAQRHGHVSQLRERRVGDHPLDVVVDYPEQTHEERGGGADHQHERQRRIGVFEQRRHARHHENAGRHHGGGMNECRDGCRTLHRVGQPYVQRHLRRLAHGADKQADADQRQRPDGRGGAQGNERVRDLRSRGERVTIGERVGEIGDAGNSQHEAEVADAIDDEGLEIGKDRARARVPEADQQIRHQAHRFPAEEQLHEVVRHDQHEHGESEQRDVAEKARVAGVIAHVADGVDVHAQRHERHHRHHQRGEPVDEEADLHVHAIADQPGVHRRVVRRHAVPVDLLQHQERQPAGNRHRRTGDGVRAGAPDEAPAQARDDGGHERQQRHTEQRGGVHARDQPFSVFRSSTLMLRRSLNSTTRMASPIADSAAATVRMKNTNTCPLMSER